MFIVRSHCGLPTAHFTFSLKSHFSLAGLKCKLSAHRIGKGSLLKQRKYSSHDVLPGIKVIFWLASWHCGNSEATVVDSSAVEDVVELLMSIMTTSVVSVSSTGTTVSVLSAVLAVDVLEVEVEAAVVVVVVGGSVLIVVVVSGSVGSGIISHCTFSFSSQF